jgi:glutamate/tyrosine decarboxylase-like PLP-dependent enzyme
VSETSPFRGPLETAARIALSHLENLDAMPVAPVVSTAELRARLTKPLADEGRDPEAVIQELADDSAGGIVGSSGGRFFSWVIGGSVPAALGADWMTAAWEQNAGLAAAGPAAAIVEEVAGEWLKELLGIPERASFGFVTGCQMAHVTSLAAARSWVLAQRGWNVETHGLFGAAAIGVFGSREIHGTVMRAARLLGMGADCVKALGADEAGRLDAAALESALAAHQGGPAVVVLQAGELNTGIYDDFETLIPIARRFGAWVHIDGAFGLWANASSQYRHLLRGAEAADSWATDGHKWLNVPYDCGYAFVVYPDTHARSMGYKASYMRRDGDARDQIDWNPEWSRRARGFATYAAIRQLGRRGVAQLVERCCAHAAALVRGIGGLPGAETLCEPTINQGLVRFLDRRPGATEADHDAATDRVIAAILKSGEAFFGGVEWRGKRAMRISVCNWMTSEADVERVIRAVERVIA